MLTIRHVLKPTSDIEVHPEEEKKHYLELYLYCYVFILSEVTQSVFVRAKMD